MEYTEELEEMELLPIDVEELSKSSNLRLLIIRSYERAYNEMEYKGSLSCLSNKLQFLEWDFYPFSYLPSCFQPNSLVELILSFSKIKTLWKGIKVLCIILIYFLGYE